MFDRVLLPTDGSATADQATEYAIDLAQRYDAEIDVVYVVDVGHVDLGTGLGEGWAGVVDKVQQAGEQEAEEVAERMEEAGVTARAATVEHQGIAEGILAYAEENGIDAIVMGTHGRSGPERWLVGSVAEGVLRRSPIPLILIPPPGKPG